MARQLKLVCTAIAMLSGLGVLAGVGIGVLHATAAPGRANHSNDRLNLFPKLAAGQVLTYQMVFHADKTATTKSNVATTRPEAPSGTKVDLRALVRLEVLGVEKQGTRDTVRARTYFQVLNATTHFQAPDKMSAPADQVQKPESKDHAIEFTLNRDGRIDQVHGLDALNPEQQQAWHQWIARFAGAAAFPKGGVRLAQKWKTEEPESAPAPIAKLTWIRESNYLRDEPCHVSQLTAEGDVEARNPQQVPETCAVIETDAALKQRSSQKDATPEDYKLHQLLTSGTASGNNKTLLYISTQTGLLVRSSDQADQAMSVTIAKTDNSNRVHYDIRARSDTQIFRIANSPLAAEK